MSSLEFPKEQDGTRIVLYLTCSKYDDTEHSKKVQAVSANAVNSYKSLIESYPAMRSEVTMDVVEYLCDNLRIITGVPNLYALIRDTDDRTLEVHISEGPKGDQAYLHFHRIQ